MQKRNKAYIVWMIILATLYICIRNSLFGAIFFSALVMLVVSIVIARLVIYGVNVRIEVEKESIERGSKAFFKVHVYNKMIFPSNKLYLKLKVNNAFFDGKEECYINIPASIRGEDIICSDVTCDYVGNVMIEGAHLMIMDYLGLVVYERDIQEIAEIVVMPTDINYLISMDYLYEEIEDGERKANIVDSSEIKGIREYKDGDTLKSIHWKLSSKLDELVVKEYEMSLSTNAEIVVDLVRDSYEVLNDTIEVLYSLVKNMIAILPSGVTVNWYDAGKEDYTSYDINSMEDVDKMLRYIYNTRFGDKTGLVYYSYVIKNNVMGQNNTLYITSREDNQEGNVVGVYNDKVVLKCI